jgi:hypothetical protein
VIGEELYAGPNPFSTSKNSQFKMPKPDNQSVRFFSPDEAKAMLQELKKRSLQLHDMSLLSLKTGMQILPATLRELMNFLGKTPDTPLEGLNSAETTHAIHYFKMQIAIQKELPIETEEEKQAARQRSEKARLAARARWDKVKS